MCVTLFTHMDMDMSVHSESGGQRPTLGVFLCCHLPSCFGTGALLNLEFTEWLAASSRVSVAVKNARNEISSGRKGSISAYRCHHPGKAGAVAGLRGVLLAGLLSPSAQGWQCPT